MSGVEMVLLMSPPPAAAVAIEGRLSARLTFSVAVAVPARLATLTVWTLVSTLVLLGSVVPLASGQPCR
ncbi:MAG: hypothetical protein GWO12_14785 [Gemmatimonadetes bacterium]|uniref:Uncharacterized protein n=1 Tax=Candidatus Kutchimonas denitrificans TaxID=3056748 RepID=A0AAE4ZC42_9BACT|nr:hypothetical protein [Candidatus Kutchimonas denitrificans]